MQPFKYGHALHRFHIAVASLATGRGDVRSRLLSAWKGDGYLMSIMPDDLPKSLQDDYLSIQSQLHSYKEKYKGQLELQIRLCRPAPDPVEATLTRIRNSTGAKIAHKILQIYDELNDMNYKHNIMKRNDNCASNSLEYNMVPVDLTKYQ